MNARDDARYRLGNGNWAGLAQSGLSLADLLEAAEEWAAPLAGVERPWLCWNVDDAWCVVQQRLVRDAGWTPLVGFDPRVGPPPLVDGAVCIDFNRRLGLPTMWLHFPLEFAFVFCDRLAFWHADCLLRRGKMATLAAMFESLRDGEMAAVLPSEGWRARLRPKQRRYWEVVGCTTRGASRSQFDNGCGWWMNFAMHPSNSAAERARRAAYYWDCGTGIRFWHRQQAGTVHLIPEPDIAEGHFSGVYRADYRRASPKDHHRNLSQELALNFNLADACRQLNLQQFLDPLPGQPAT